MIRSEEVPAAAARLDELRHRLYRPDASEEDRQEYAALRDELAGVDQAPPADEQRASDGDPGSDEPEPAAVPAARGVAHRPRLLIAAALVAAVILVTVIGIAQTDGSRSTAAPRPSALPRSAEPALIDIPTLGPTPLPKLDGGTAVVAQQASGGGSAVVPLETAAAPADGVLVVALSSSAPTSVGWRAERRANRSDHSSYLQTVATSGAAMREGAPNHSRSAYEGAAPSQIVVGAPTGVGWNLVVEFLPQQSGGLH